jgi:hypothetical protein
MLEGKRYVQLAISEQEEERERVNTEGKEIRCFVSFDLEATEKDRR